MDHEEDSEFDAYEDELLAQTVGGAYGRGAERGTRILRSKNVLEIRLSLSLSPDQVIARTFEAIGQTARLLERSGSEQAEVRVVGIIGSGAMNMNPTVVLVTISKGTSGCQVTVRGAAKEGLVFKQRAGEKAAKRIAAALT